MDKRTFDGAPVCLIEVDSSLRRPPLRDRLHAAGIDTFEADVRFAVRYLIERGIKGGCEIDGDASAGRAAIAWVFDNPSLRSADVTVEPRVLSFDIETDAQGERLLAISLYAPGVDEVLIVDGSGRPMPERATRCVDEFAALDAFCERIRALRSGRADRLEHHRFRSQRCCSESPRVCDTRSHWAGTRARLRIRKAEGYFGSGQASIPGRLVLDGIDLLRGAFMRMDDYSLDAVAREVLGEGKAVAGDVHDRIGRDHAQLPARSAGASRSMRARMRGSPIEIVAEARIWCGSRSRAAS